MPGITKIEDALQAVELNSAKLRLLEQLESVFQVPEDNEWAASPQGYPVELKVVRYKTDLRALMIKELRGEIARIDGELCELGIELDA